MEGWRAAGVSRRLASEPRASARGGACARQCVGLGSWVLRTEEPRTSVRGGAQEPPRQRGEKQYRHAAYAVRWSFRTGGVEAWRLGGLEGWRAAGVSRQRTASRGLPPAENGEPGARAPGGKSKNENSQ